MKNPELVYRMKNRSSLLVAILCLYFSQNFATAQEKISKYPQDYFRNPLDIPISLAGNFGECRPNHFHSGLDIKTEGRENLVVRAAAEGYVSRMKIEKGGFGHALYITHPNGFTTVYAHLNDFNPALQKFLRKQQYEKQSWTVDVILSPEEFPVKKWEQIAWSGNTGGSAGPHLHFEIRDTETEHPLNGALFGLDIKDTQPPIPTEIALYNLNKRFYEQSPTYYKLTKQGNKYAIKDSVKAYGTHVGISIAVNDFMNGSTNTLNFYEAKWYKDDVLQGSITLDDIGYGATRYLHAYADYKTKKLKNTWFQCLFKMKGNALNIYENMNPVKGAMELESGKQHLIRIELTDAFNNTAVVEFKLWGFPDLQEDSCENLLPYNQPKKWQPYTNLQINFSDKVFYDDVCFNLSKKSDASLFSERYKIGETYIPAHDYFTIKIKPNKPVPFTLRNKIAMIYNNGKSESGKAAVWENAWYTAKVRNFGEYYLKTDTTAPTLQNLQKHQDLSKASAIRFAVKEETTSIKEFRAEVNGKWLLFEPFGGVYVYKLDEHFPKGKHEIVVRVKDENENERVGRYQFVR